MRFWMARRVYPTCCEIEGGLTFLPSLLALADEVFELRFRTAAIEGGEVTLWGQSLPKRDVRRNVRFPRKRT